MRIAVAALICLLPAIGAADTVSIGDVTAAIPSPEGFAAVTQKMAALYDFQKQFVDPTNDELGAFIPEGDVSAALKGEIPDFPRHCSAQIPKKAVNLTLSASDFTKLKSSIKSQHAELVKRAELTYWDRQPLAFHEESDRTRSRSPYW
jgi:hypothetical protein